jgi:hypothetical protein
MSQNNHDHQSSKESRSNDVNLAKGLIFAHNAIGNNIVSIQKVAAHLYALTEALVNKGVLSLYEVDQRKQTIDQQMMAQMREKWMGARMLADENDKYDPENEVLTDCETRRIHCKAICCRLGFYLSQQDLEEGIIRWDFGRPYHIAQGEDGYCVYRDPRTHKCTIWTHRPLICRAYDCRNDKRIWADFEKMILNPELEKR